LLFLYAKINKTPIAIGKKIRISTCKTIKGLESWVMNIQLAGKRANPQAMNATPTVGSGHRPGHLHARPNIMINIKAIHTARYGIKKYKVAKPPDNTIGHAPNDNDMLTMFPNMQAT
jgi:hypothetical protein